MKNAFLPLFLIILLSMIPNIGISQTGQTNYPGGLWEPGPANYGSTGLRDITIKLKEGITLKASVSYPADKRTGKQSAEKFPVIIEMTPYPLRGESPISPVSYMNSYGYIYLIVRPRGTGGSEGEMQQFSSIDGNDGNEVADWAAHELAGTDGRIGLHGCSYPGAVALATAAQAGKVSPIKAIITANIGLDMQHREVWTTNGLPNAALSYAPNATRIMGDLPSIREYWKNYYDGIMSGGPEAYDGYWKDRLPLKWAQNIAYNGIPALFWTGWSDINEIGSIHAYSALQNAINGKPFYQPMAKDIIVSPKYQIIVGDWGHGQGLDPGIFLEWFETWLKGVKTGIQNTSTPMHLFEMGTERWVNTDRYPVVRKYDELYLVSGEKLEKSGNKVNYTSELRWTNPEKEKGKLKFETSAFKDGVTIAGPMSVTVYVSSNNTNIVLLAKLYDVAPDGTSRRITYGGLLGSQSELNDEWSWTDESGKIIWPWPKLEKDIYLKPDKIYRFEVPMAARQWALQPGHSLRLELTTQSTSDVCPENGQFSLVSEPCRLTKPQQETVPGGIYRIYAGTEYPSSMKIPLLPFNSFEGVRSGPPPTNWPNDQTVGQGSNFTLPLEW